MGKIALYLRPIEIAHILHLLREERVSGFHYGDRGMYEARQNELIKMLEGKLTLDNVPAEPYIDPNESHLVHPANSRRPTKK
jgi:hypothetical protein